MAVAVTQAKKKASRWWWKQEPVRAKPTLPGPCAAGEKESHNLDRLKSVQDQLYSRDLPTVSKALKYTAMWRC